MSEPAYPWERPLGAFPSAHGTTVFRIWAPRPQRIAVGAGGREHELGDAGFGLHEAELPIGSGEDYAYVLDGAELPDPCSRWQPAGLHGPSRVLDTSAFEWTNAGFTPPTTRDLVIYELHVGTFTEDGTFEAAIPHLSELRELGITAIELMPVAVFPGAHGWGYDGVYISAAHGSYGGPLGLQKLVDAAHGEGLAVLLDVV
ncbi:MAG: alpha-amylase family glycosyl hydrolase, partial [Solirubrobacteraceae bacterium]